MSTTIDGDKVYADAKALCYGAAMEAAAPFERKRLADFSTCERQMIDRIAEWMGSRDCQIAKYEATIPALVKALRNTMDYWDSCGFSTCEPGCTCIVDDVRAALALLEPTK